MRRALHVFIVLAFASAACGAPQPSEPPIESPARGLRLVGDDARWYVTGLGDDAAGLVEQGRLFAVLRPIPGTTDQEPVAVMKALGPASGSSVAVAPQCVVPETMLAKEMSVAPLSSATRIKVGPCLAQVVDAGTSETGEDYVILDVGSGAGVSPGDQFILLGRAVSAEGHVPLALDTAEDGLCQIPSDPMHLKPVTARCVIVEPTRDISQLRGSFAAWMTR